jgi:hypothetical protein
MYRSICNLLIFIVLFCSISEGFSQNFQIANEVTKKLYDEKKWDKLIEVSDSILKTGLDFYALRLRLGFAYYFKNEYLNAIPHFIKANEMNNTENIATEYLYYCYFQSAQYLQALKLISNQNEYLKLKVQFNSMKRLQSTQLRYGNKNSNSDYIPNAIETDVDLDFKLFKSCNIKFSLNQISQKNSVWQIKQNQYFTALSIPLKNNWNLHSGFSFLNYSYTLNKSNPTIGNQWVESIEMDKLYLKSQFTFGLASLTGDSTKHYQLTLGYTYFPKANLNLFYGFNYFKSTQDNFSNFANAYKAFLGFKLNPKTTIISSVLKGGGHNLVTFNGEIVNNNFDITSNIYEFGLKYNLHPKWQTGIFYNLELKENNTINNYHYNSIFINLKFTP